jgi:deuterolysin
MLLMSLVSIQSNSHSILVADIFDFASAGSGTFSFTPRADFKIATAEAVEKSSVNVPTVEVEVIGAIARKAKRATDICEDPNKASFINAA